MTFFYDLNKTLDAIREKPELKHGQLNERANSKPVEEGLGDVVRKVGGAVKSAAKKGLDTLGHGSDEDMIRDLQKKAGVPQTGKKPVQPKEGVDKVAFAKLAPPEDKITFADKIAGAKKEVDEMLGDVAAEAMKAALSPKQKKLDKNNNGKLDANDFAMLRKGAKSKEETDEGSTGDYSAKKARAGKDIGKPGKAFAKIAKGAAERYGSKAAGERVAGAVLNKLRHPGELEENAAAGYDPETQARIKAATPQQLAQMAQEFAGGPAQYQSELKMLQQAKAELSGQMEEGWDDMLKDVEKRRGAMKTGEKRKTSKGEVEKTATGLKHTRSYDEKTGETDDDAPAGEKRGRGRPKGPAKAPERVTAKATKHKGGRKAVGEDGSYGQAQQIYDELADIRAVAKQVQTGQGQFPQGFASRLENSIWAAMSLIKNQQPANAQVREEDLDEKAVSKAQQRFMGMVHATQKGEKAPSKEVAKVAKTMKKKDAEDFAATKHKGLPEKKKPEAKKSDAPKKDSKPEGKKKEKTEEAGGTGTPTASSGFSYGKGIYDSMNYELETMIAESMSVNLSSDSEGQKSITVTAQDEDAVKLAALLKSAGLGGGDSEGYGGSGYQSACGCGTPDCSCGDEQVDENSPDWPTNQETAQDNLEYSGGLNGPKSTGQTTVPVIAGQEEREGTYAEAEEDAIKRMMEMAGIKEGKKPDFLDVDKDGDKKEPFKKAVDDKKEKKVDEGILAATTNLWSEYKGKYGV